MITVILLSGIAVSSMNSFFVEKSSVKKEAAKQDSEKGPECQVTTFEAVVPVLHTVFAQIPELNFIPFPQASHVVKSIFNAEYVSSYFKTLLLFYISPQAP
ncbi:MAG: hypothetical protein ACK40G_04370 [Cytophagaceae bacterium]